ncbi:unnamed protein product [Rotaria sp. Silwood1]|nr:unnamed protein product [Rotaria sp. Silwood1]CAF4487733.1 unnamed protein product [Rotaria sp. Silwood1]
MANTLILCIFILIILNFYWSYGANGATRDQLILANFKAQLSKARTLKQALAIYADANVRNRHQVAMQTDLRKIEKEINTQLADLDLPKDDKIVPYVNGGCLPRITCVPVYAQQATTGGIVFPNCVEVHRCSGCCQETQFSCEPTKIDYVSFSPIIKFEHGDGSIPPIAALKPFKTENHTECTCKCKLKEDACPSNAQVLDHELCRCREQACFPQCQAMQRCQLLSTQDKPSCVCKRPIPGQNGAYSCPSGFQPDARCKSNKHQQAEIRARLARAKSIKEVLIILKSSSNEGRHSLLTSEALDREQASIRTVAQQLKADVGLTVEPRNGVCEPRVLCEQVPVDRKVGHNTISFPQCLEIHRCGGCCQEVQFSCIPTQQQPVTFSPLLLISLDDTNQYEVNRPLTLMNHTHCECKCNKKEDECFREGKTLDSVLCQCVQPRCVPECRISSTCSIVHGSSIPRCTCRRRIQGQASNYCPNPNQRPDEMCRRCETFYG